jgi:hypothetical protein
VGRPAPFASARRRPMTVHLGFRADLDLPVFLAAAGLTPASIEKVNVPHIWTLVTCVRDARQTDADSR